jgi:uncharacterized cupredoxin-like copper-binding protein
LRVVRNLAFLVLAAFVAALVASPVGAEPSKTIVHVRLVEFKVQPRPGKAIPGAVSFVARNAGTVRHELVVLKTKLPPGKLPLRGTRAAEPGRVGRIGPVAPGRSRTLNLLLKPGKYVLLCNLAGHYVAGQRIGFTVG